MGRAPGVEATPGLVPGLLGVGLTVTMPLVDEVGDDDPLLGAPGVDDDSSVGSDVGTSSEPAVTTSVSAPVFGPSAATQLVQATNQGSTTIERDKQRIGPHISFWRRVNHRASDLERQSC